MDFIHIMGGNFDIDMKRGNDRTSDSECESEEDIDRRNNKSIDENRETDTRSEYRGIDKHMNRGTNKDIDRGIHTLSRRETDEYICFDITQDEIKYSTNTSTCTNAGPKMYNDNAGRTLESIKSAKIDMSKDSVDTATEYSIESVKDVRCSDRKTVWKPMKHSDFSVKSRDDERSVWIEGVLTIADRLVVVDAGNYKMKLFDANGTLLSSTSFPHIVFDIAHVDGDTFATCGHGFKIQKWKVLEDTIVTENSSYNIEYEAQAMCFDGTYYCVLHRRENTISILSKKGKPFTKFSIKTLLGKKLEFGSSILMEYDSHSIFVPAWGDFRGILCLSVHGSPLWYSPIHGSPECITMIGNSLCIADEKSQCLHVMSRTGRSTDVFVHRDDLSGIPHRVFYDRHKNKLYISYQNYDQKSRHIVSMFSV